MSSKSKRRDQEDAEIPIASMIDVVFLLIIFFVVTAAIDKEIEDEAVNLATAPHGKPMAKKDPRSVIINVRNDGKVTMAGQIMPLRQVSNNLRVAAGNWGVGFPIIVRGDRKTQHGYIKKVMEAVTDTKLYRVRFMAVVEEAKPQ